MFSLECLHRRRLGTGQEGMGHSDRLKRRQRLAQDCAITREQQRSLIEEARAARQEEQIARARDHATVAAADVSAIPSQNRAQFMQTV